LVDPKVGSLRWEAWETYGNGEVNQLDPSPRPLRL
jgi:hypothetical protein